MIGIGVECGISNLDAVNAELKEIPFKSATLELTNIEIPRVCSLRKIVKILKVLPY